MISHLFIPLSSELLDPVTNGSLSSRSGAIIGMPGYMARDGNKELDLSDLVIKPHYNRWFKGFKIPENIRYALFLFAKCHFE